MKNEGELGTPDPKIVIADIKLYASFCVASSLESATMIASCCAIKEEVEELMLA